MLIEPLFMMGLLLFVFGFGLKGDGVDLKEFAPLLFSGLIAYYFFNDNMNSGVGAISKYRFLLNKVNFNLLLLPFVQIGMSLFFHFIFLGIMIVFLLALGVYPTLYWLQAIIYLVLATLFLAGITLILSSLEPFFPDLKKIIPLCSRVFFWGTPIFWNVERLPERFRFVVDYNPLYYFVRGYRDSFINNVSILEYWPTMMGFFIVSIILLSAGVAIHRKARPYFAEVI